jgi:hypothetical protein
MPLNSSTMRSCTTLKRSRIKRGSASRNSSGVAIPIARRRSAKRRAIPQRSVSSMLASAARCACSVSSRLTPPDSGFFFAKRLAALASVLVGAMPTDTGIPVHC